ncbi:hypothetical protein BC835DRAFT_1277494 [Cytidiella melzeri]|nr:hypothetical protein BC835DRAFT_1277494 [Cytidiella melzeri]
MTSPAALTSVLSLPIRTQQHSPKNPSGRYGPIFIGMVINLLLYGIMITQTYWYFDTFKRDKIWMKLFVALLLICDTLNSAFDVSFVYIPLVADYGITPNWSSTPALVLLDPAMTAIVAFLVQMFFAWRVRVLSNNWPLVAFIATCSICQFMGGLGTSIACGIVPEFVQFRRFQVVVIVWLTCSAVADTAITLSLVWHLQKHKTGLIGTDDVVNKIIRLTVQTGMITAVCAIIDLVLFLITPSGLHLIFNLPLSKLYTNTLMSSLNSRVSRKKRPRPPSDSRVTYPGRSTESDSGSMPSKLSPFHPHIAVCVRSQLNHSKNPKTPKLET